MLMLPPQTPWFLMPFILLLWPLVWLWKAFSPLGGREYAVAHASCTFTLNTMPIDGQS